MKTTLSEIQDGYAKRFVRQEEGGPQQFEEFLSQVGQMFLYRPSLMQDVKYLAVSTARATLEDQLSIYGELVDSIKGLRNVRLFDPFLPSGSNKLRTRATEVANYENGVGERDNLLWADLDTQASKMAQAATKSMKVKGKFEADEPYKTAFSRFLAAKEAYEDFVARIGGKLEDVQAFSIPTERAVHRSIMRVAYQDVADSLDEVRKLGSTVSPWDVVQESAAMRSMSQAFKNFDMTEVLANSLPGDTYPGGSNLRFRVLGDATPGSVLTNVIGSKLSVVTEADAASIDELDSAPHLLTEMDYAVGAGDLITLTFYWAGEAGLDVNLNFTVSAAAAAGLITAADPDLTAVVAPWDSNKLLITVAGSEYLGVTGILEDLNRVGFHGPLDCGQEPDFSTIMLDLENSVSLCEVSGAEVEIVPTTVTYEGGDLRLADATDVQADDIISVDGVDFRIGSITGGLATVTGSASVTIGYPHLPVVPNYSSEPCSVVRRTFTFSHSGTGWGFVEVEGAREYNLFTQGVVHGRRLATSKRGVVVRSELLGFEVGDHLEIEDHESTISAIEDYSGAYENPHSEDGALVTFTPGVEHDGDFRFRIKSYRWDDAEAVAAVSWDRNVRLERELAKIGKQERVPASVVDKCVELLQIEAQSVFEDPTDLGIASSVINLESQLGLLDADVDESVVSILDTLRDNGWTNAEKEFVAGNLNELFLLTGRDASMEGVVKEEIDRASAMIPTSSFNDDADFGDLMEPTGEILDNIE
jgi:hypothetical protein